MNDTPHTKRFDPEAFTGQRDWHERLKELEKEELLLLAFSDRYVNVLYEPTPRELARGVKTSYEQRLQDVTASLLQKSGKGLRRTIRQLEERFRQRGLPKELRRLDNTIASIHGPNPRQFYEGLYSPDEIIAGLEWLVKEHAGDDLTIYHHTSCVTMPDDSFVPCVYLVRGTGSHRLAHHYPLHRAFHAASNEEPFSLGSFFNELQARLGGEAYLGLRQDYRFDLMDDDLADELF